MNQDSTDRKHPAHFPVIQRQNKPAIIFLTVYSKGRRKIFDRKEVFDLLIESWTKADYWKVGSFVVMPEHIHLFCANYDYRHPDLSSWVNYWKSLVSKKWPFPGEHPIWQRDYWDRQLRSDENYYRKWEYVRNNPVRHGLARNPDDWHFQGTLNSFN